MASIQRDADPASLFEVLERVGEGSYGRVYKALDRGSAAVVALKVVPCSSDDDNTAFQQIAREIAILESCHSPHVVQYYGSFLFDAHLWIAMEFCAAGSLADLLGLPDRHSRTLTEPQVAAVCANVVRGLQYLHSHRKLHRDVKAANILLSASGHAKLADFGVSAQLTDTLHKRRTVIGTPYWMAPEVIQEAHYDGKADVWSLGITAIELAEGAPPLANVHPMRAIFMIPTRAPPTLQHADSFSPEFNSFLTQCLQKDPAQRPDADALLHHAFVRRYVEQLDAHPDAGLPVLQELVDDSLDLVDQARDARAEDECEFRRVHTGHVHGSLSIADVATMLRNGNVAVSNISTMVEHEDDGTMVFAGGVSAWDSGGTMVPASRSGYSDTLVEAASDPTNDQDSGDVDAATLEPSFMKFFRAPQQDESATMAAWSKSATIRPVAAVDRVNSVRQQLQALEAQYERDVQALWKRYEADRRQLEQLLEE